MPNKVLTPELINTELHLLETLEKMSEKNKEKLSKIGVTKKNKTKSKKYIKMQKKSRKINRGK